MCTSGASGSFGITQTAFNGLSDPHDHLTGTGNALSTAAELVVQINAGTPAFFALPRDGADNHSHVITFTPEEYATLRNGGTVTKTHGVDDRDHTHTYVIECTP